MDCGKFMWAMATYNADPFIVEDMGYARELAEATQDAQERVYTPQDEDFEDLCAKLDLDPVKHSVKAIHSYSSGALVCYSENWK